MKNEPIVVKITKKHFDAAVKADMTAWTSETCLLAQAFKDVFPRKHIAVGSGTVTVGSGKSVKNYVLDTKAQKLIMRFDGTRRKSVRNSLPTTVTIIREVAV